MRLPCFSWLQLPLGLGSCVTRNYDASYNLWGAMLSMLTLLAGFLRSVRNRSPKFAVPCSLRLHTEAQGRVQCLVQVSHDPPASLAAHQPAGQLQSCDQQDPAAQQLWQKFVLSRKSIMVGAGLGAGAALVLWSGGLLAAPALHLAGFGVAGANAGTVAAAASLGPTLAASGVCAAACPGAGGAAALPLMSNAVLSAAGGSMLGGAGAASMALLLRGLAQGGQLWQQVDRLDESSGSSESGEARPVER